jgi:hypothetical protein
MAKPQLMMPTAGTMPNTRTELVGCRKLPKAMARTIAAMAPGCALANKEIHDFIRAQRHRKQPRAVAVPEKSWQSRRF